MIRFICCLCTAIFTAYASAKSVNCQTQQCLAVVDAGSTGSRLYIYAYERDKTNSPIHITELWHKKIIPGFASLEPKQNEVSAYLGHLFSGEPQVKIPVYFYATAGMRLVSQQKQQQLYTLLKNWFAQQSQWQLMSAKTITGTEEGLFDWLAMNYQLGGFFNKEEVPLGVMDMGGASVQVIFPVEDKTGINYNDLYNFDLYGRHYSLFIHSFLGLGQTEVTHQFLDEGSCFANNYQLPTGEPATGDAYSCKGRIISLMNKVHHVSDIVQNAMKVNPITRWYVMGAIVPLAKSQLFQFTSQQFTSRGLLEQADRQICQQPWITLTAQYPDDEYLYGYCLYSSYYYALMVEGYGINSQQLINYATPEADSWTLGVVLHQKSAFSKG